MDEMPYIEYPDASVKCTVTAQAGDASDYDRMARPGLRTVPAGPIAEFVAAVVEGSGDRGTKARQAIAQDDQYGPIHLVRLVGAARLTARAFVHAGMVAGEMYGADIDHLLAGDVSQVKLSDLVAVVRSAGLHAATEVARAMTVEQRLGVLSELSSYVCAFTRDALGDPAHRFPPAAGE